MKKTRQKVKKTRHKRMGNNVDNPHVCETEHDFTLVLTGIPDLTRGVEDALYESGCSDATLSMRLGGVYLTFSRSAPSIKDAILSAIRDVRKANLGAEVLRVDVCDLVTQAEIGRKIGRKRQQIHQYITGERGPGNFPPPACNIADGSPLWLWCEVAYWLWENNLIKQEVLLEAQQVAGINTVLGLCHQQRLAPELMEEILRAVTAENG